MNITLWIFSTLAVLVVILIIGSAIGRFIKRSDEEIDRMTTEEARRRFWERKR